MIESKIYVQINFFVDNNHQTKAYTDALLFTGKIYKKLDLPLAFS